LAILSVEAPVWQGAKAQAGALIWVGITDKDITDKIIKSDVKSRFIEVLVIFFHS